MKAGTCDVSVVLTKAREVAPSQASRKATQLTWDEVSYGIGNGLLIPCREEVTKGGMSSLIYGSFNGTPEFNELPARDYRNACKIVPDSLEVVMHQFLALGLADVELIQFTVPVG